MTLEEEGEKGEENDGEAREGRRCHGPEGKMS